MSSPSQQKSPSISKFHKQHSIPAHSQPAKDQIVESLQQLDQKLERLNKEVLPAAPYLLRLKARGLQSKQGAYLGRKDTYFSADEEELQYMTFRQTHDGTFLQAHGQWDDENGGMATKEDQTSQTSSGRTPLGGQAGKKKISLEDYKKMDKTKPRTSDANSTAVKGPTETKTQDMNEAPKKGEGKEGGVDPIVETAADAGQVIDEAQKRSTDAKIAKPNKPIPTTALEDKVYSAAAKPAKATPTEGTNPQMAIASPRQVDPAPLHGLPPMLSPTLPDEIEEELAKVESVSKKRLIVTFIIKKAYRSQLMKYLKLKPTPASAKPSSTSLPAQETESSASDEPLSNRKPGARLASQKDNDEFEREAKRRKGPTQQHKSSQASQKPGQGSKPLRQPAASTHQKGRLSAPLSNIKSSAMQRTDSQESASTPTPLQPSRDATPVVPTSNGVKGESAELRKWRNELKKESARYLEMASEIKHDSDAYLKLEGKKYEDSRELGCIIAAEAALCFMLAAVISDEPFRASNTLSNTALWHSTRFYIARIAENHARPLHHLYGFFGQLEGLICDTVEYQTDLRLDAIMKEYRKLKEGEADDSDPEKAVKYVNEQYHAIAKKSTENRRLARTAWHNGDSHLYIADFEQHFPKTWQGRRNFVGRGKGRDRVHLHNYTKEGYSLPLGTNSTGLEAVNFGLAFLSEIAKKNKLQWKPKFLL